MFKYGVQCAPEQLPERMPVVFRGPIAQSAEQAKQIGYDGLELYIHDPKDQDVAGLLSAAKDNGLEYCGICTGLEYIFNKLCLTSDDPAVRQAAVDRLKEHLDLGVQLGCPVVVGTMRGHIPGPAHYKEYLGRLAEGMVKLNEHAENIGGELLIENIHQYVSNWLNTIPEVGDYVRSLGLSRVGLHIDTHSMHIEDSDPYNAVRNYKDVLKYVHFSDSNRWYPGGGVIDFKAYYHALMDAEYSGYITAEYQALPDAFTSAKLGYEYMKLMERAAEIERLNRKEI